jgi:hypothetical protein
MPWFPVLQILHCTAFIIEIMLIVAILYLNRKNSVNRVAAILILCYAIWSLGKLFLENPGTPQEVAEWVYRLYPIGWCSFASLTLYFTLLCIEKKTY